MIGFGALLFTAPAGLAAHLVAAATPELRLFAPSGRLLAGSGDLLVQGRPFGRLSWETDLTALPGRLKVDLAIRASGYQAQAQLALRPSGAFSVAGLNAEIHDATLDILLQPYAIAPSGHITVTSGSARGNLGARRINEMNAEVRWSGGPVRYRLGGGNWSASFPPLDGRLHMRDGAPLLVVQDFRGNELLDASLGVNGWADLRVRYRFVALAGYPWPDAPAPDAIVVELSEQVL